MVTLLVIQGMLKRRMMANTDHWKLWMCNRETGADSLQAHGSEEQMRDDMQRFAEAGRDVWLIDPMGIKHLPDGRVELRPGFSAKQLPATRSRALVAFRTADTALVLQAEGTPDFEELCLTDGDFTENIIASDPGMRPDSGLWVWEGEMVWHRGHGMTADAEGETTVHGSWRPLTKTELTSLQTGLTAWVNPNTPSWINVVDYAPQMQTADAGCVFIQKVAEAKRLHCLAYLDFEDCKPEHVNVCFVHGMMYELRDKGYDRKYLEMLRHANLITAEEYQRVNIRRWLQSWNS
jgi:hypothetical protein